MKYHKNMDNRLPEARRIGKKAAMLLTDIGRGMEVAKNRQRLQALEAELSSMVINGDLAAGYTNLKECL